MSIHYENNSFLIPCVYPELIRQNKLPGSKTVTVTVPGSKSITNRALLLATLANGCSTLRGALFSDDSRYFLQCIQDLGFITHVDEASHTINVQGLDGRIPTKEVALYVGSAGTAARFLSALLGVSDGLWHIDASEQMRRRPMAPLLSSLEDLGCEIIYEGAQASLPFTLRGKGFLANTLTVDIANSSQFLSALLIIASLCPDDFHVQMQGEHGMSYVDMTLAMMRQFGVMAQKKDDTFSIAHGQHYKAVDYQIEPDVSAACYFYALAPLLSQTILVKDIHQNSLQGDIAFLRILERLGCKTTDTPEGILLTPPPSGTYPGITVDMSACSDQAITLACIAPFAGSPTTITGIGHTRFQESDRIHAIATQLKKMGIRCDETETSLKIYPGNPKSSLVDTYEDHRMAMGFSLIGLRSEGIRIDNPSCCKKTFENYFEVLTEVLQTL